jgi:hypothetical protein
MPSARKKPAKPGLRGLMVRVKARGTQAVDRRTVAYKAVKEWREALITALGGETEVSPQRATLIELATRTRLYLDHVDAFILEQKTLVNRRKKIIFPIVLQRQQLADSLQRMLITLGLDRLPKPVPTMADLLRKHDEEKELSQ